MEDGKFSIDLPVDTVVTLSTLSGQQKGTFGNIPPSMEFPVPYNDSFDCEKYHHVFASVFILPPFFPSSPQPIQSTVRLRALLIRLGCLKSPRLKTLPMAML